MNKSFEILHSDRNLSNSTYCTAEIVNLSANHSLHDRENRILKVCRLLQLVEEYSKAFTTQLLADSLKIRQDARKKVLGNLQPQELKSRLLEAPLLCASIFPKDVLEKADELATRAFHTTYKPAYDKTKAKPPQEKKTKWHKPNMKRLNHFEEPQNRKYFKPQDQQRYKYQTTSSQSQGRSQGSHSNTYQQKFRGRDSYKRQTKLSSSKYPSRH